MGILIWDEVDSVVEIPEFVPNHSSFRLTNMSEFFEICRKYNITSNKSDGIIEHAIEQAIEEDFSRFYYYGDASYFACCIFDSYKFHLTFNFKIIPHGEGHYGCTQYGYGYFWTIEYLEMMFAGFDFRRY